MPTYDLEAAVEGLVCGVDEAGRGPLAGPVVAAAAFLSIDDVPESLRLGLNDSKKLSEKKREGLLALMTDCPAVWVVAAEASVEEIDRLNILRATHLAMQRAVEALQAQLPRPLALALIDGNQLPKQFSCPMQAVVKGDGLSLSIAAASICAKVTRDRLMRRLDADFPVYGWARNAGYGTAEHRAAIARHGITKHHRKSFAQQGELFSV